MKQITLSSQQAKLLDEDLFQYFSLEILMELAGQSCANAIYHYLQQNLLLNKTISVVCGPGNNGGDGLVCARHLKMLGVKNIVVYVPRTQFVKLVQQCTLNDIEVVSNADQMKLIDQTDIIVDAVFGFSFSGDIREPYLSILQMFKNKIVISIDCPSGWPIDMDKEFQRHFTPNCVISLSCCKKCGIIAQNEGAIHYLGANIIPNFLKSKYQLQYGGLWDGQINQFVELK